MAAEHRWFGEERPFATLIGAIDDATSRVSGATFRAEEDGAGSLTTLTQTSDRYGLPWLLYSDRHGIFHRDRRRPPTLTEQLTGQRSLTQVGRALEVAGIGSLPASSPEAKGLSGTTVGHPRGWLVLELRLEGIATIAEVNHFLQAISTGTTPGSRSRSRSEPAWRPWPAGLSAEAVFAFWYGRTVTRDDTLAPGQDALAVPRRADGRTRAGQKVSLAERLDGSLWAELDGCSGTPRGGAPVSARAACPSWSTGADVCGCPCR